MLSLSLSSWSLKLEEEKKGVKLNLILNSKVWTSVQWLYKYKYKDEL